ncbi:MAG: OB-fold domain-containing protein [Proteobacteria bacterium]|nr:OB-fold domain-containing protein [Pseudomonadota bacterium]
MPEQIPVREGTFRDGSLLANKCRACGQTFFPKADLCLSCSHDVLDEVVLGRQGVLYSWTIAHMPASRFMPPYAMGYVDLPEGVRVFAPLIMEENRPFRTGMDMGLVIEPLWIEGDREVVGYKFRSLGEGGAS